MLYKFLVTKCKYANQIARGSSVATSQEISAYSDQSFSE